MNRPLFPTTLLILSYDIGKLVGLRNYQHLLAVLGHCQCFEKQLYSFLNVLRPLPTGQYNIHSIYMLIYF